MSEKKKKDSTVINAFGGVDLTRSYGDVFSARNIENFRILNDGSLEKRCGFRCVGNVGQSIRAVCGSYSNGEFALLALIANKVYSISADLTKMTEIGKISSYGGEAYFFFFRETLYLLDGKNVYEYQDGEFTYVVGYVPLVGKDWPASVPGEINEPRNILNNHARITYVVDSPSVYLCTRYPVDSVEAVYLNGGLLPESAYRIDDEFNTVVIKELTVGDRVEIFLTYMDGYDDLYSHLCAAKSSVLFGGMGKNRILLCRDGETGIIFSSKNVSSDDLNESRRHYPESGILYFPAGYEFEAGDGMSEVQSMLRFGDRVIIFTETDVWMAIPDDEGKDFATTVGVNAEIGCPVADGAVLSDNEPISIGYRALYSWKTGASGILEAVNISKQIEKELDDDFLRKCGIYYDTARNELWLYHKKRPIIWIYNTVRKVWYSFTGIIAEKIFDLDGSVAFIRGGNIYVFDESLGSDIDADGSSTPVSAVYTSCYSDLGVAGNKNLRTVGVDARLLDDALTIEIDTPGFTREHTIIPEKGADYSPLTVRLATDRFKYASFSIISNGLERQKIHSLTLHIR